MFAQPNALPRANQQFAIVDLNRKRTADKRCLHMRRHIVAAFECVSVRPILQLKTLQMLS